MSTASDTWRFDFGIANRRPPTFYSEKAQINDATPQAHLLRRAFETLHIDGVLCADNSPLVYFKTVDSNGLQNLQSLHRQFWNYGGASVLVVVGPNRVDIYSGMIRPAVNEDDESIGLVTTLERVASQLQVFLASVESGEFFHRHRKSFDPAQRVDRDLLKNLKNAREKVNEISHRENSPAALDALLCRLVFTSYLFDRSVIGESYLTDAGITNAVNLRDVLNIQPPNEAKKCLYRLFEKLSEDFNGDLFSDDLVAERATVLVGHVEVLRDFFNGTDVTSGQQSFWPYDFGVIPIETISAIYERFLKDSDKDRGAFYTPRFLAEVVIDTAIRDTGTMIGKRFLDPACGSGIFLVGIFNRIAEEWKQANPRARNDRKARELMDLLRGSLFGVDVSLTACRIAAFSLYLAYLDQLNPSDIQTLQRKGRALPRLIRQGTDDVEGNIWNVDFFKEEVKLPVNVDIVVGNPPWGSIAGGDTAAGKWCSSHSAVIPNEQIATAFIWKAVQHVAAEGNICFVLPHGVLFNHSPQAIRFQRSWVQSCSIEQVVNLADLRYLLFENAIHPAIVVRYKNEPPQDSGHRIEYWTPKADWTLTQAEVITVSSSDRTRLKLADVNRNLESEDAPQIWKKHHWATERDARLIDRLASLPRLRDIVRQVREQGSAKPWLIAEGFQPIGENDDPKEGTLLELPSKLFIEASSKLIDLLILEEECGELESNPVEVRNKSNKNTAVFRGPHVLVSKGFNRVAYADFHVSFRHALRGITGPSEDDAKLAFLAAYLRSPLARYYLFHTSSNWGIYRPEVHVHELLGVPFLLPEQHSNPDRATEIVEQVKSLIDRAKSAIRENLLERQSEIANVKRSIEELVNEYFDVLPPEAVLVDDTSMVIIPSIQPTYRKMPVETVKPASFTDFKKYQETLCGLLNRWGGTSGESVSSQVISSSEMGIAIAVVTKSAHDSSEPSIQEDEKQLIDVLSRIRSMISEKSPSIEVLRGLMVFDGDKLYLVKQISRRFWTRSAALNDADQIASSILMSAVPGDV